MGVSNAEEGGSARRAKPKSTVDNAQRTSDREKPGSNRPVRYGRTETGRVFETALKVDADYRMKDGGETAIVQWLVETVDATELQTIVIYENGKVPNWPIATWTPISTSRRHERSSSWRKGTTS